MSLAHQSAHSLNVPASLLSVNKEQNSQGCIGMDYLSRSDQNLAGKDTFVLFFVE